MKTVSLGVCSLEAYCLDYHTSSILAVDVPALPLLQTLKQWGYLQVLGQVLKVLDVLHEAGYAHRNIKPSNILQRDKQHDWMLSNFAASCPVGAALSFHAFYTLWGQCSSLKNWLPARKGGMYLVLCVRGVTPSE